MYVDHTRPVITVITAFGRPEYDYLRQAGESLIPLNSYATNEGAGVEWLIAMDPENGLDPSDLTSALFGLPVSRRIIETTGHVTGPGPARNAALAEATSAWVYSLDGDDLVDSYALMRLHAEALREDVAWAAGRSSGIDSDGTPLWDSPPDVFPAGRLPLNAYYEARLRNGDWPFLTNTVLARTEAVRAFGGWADLVRGEDTAMVSVLSAQNEGVWVPEQVHRYRKHPESITADKEWWTEDEGLAVIANFVESGSIPSHP